RVDPLCVITIPLPVRGVQAEAAECGRMRARVARSRPCAQAGPMLDVPPSHLRDLVAAAPVVSEVVWLPQVDSTNAEVARRAAAGAQAGLLVVTDEQTAGRGRQGRRWQAPPGTSLMLSLLLRDGAAIEDVALLPLLTGVALAEAVETVVP